MSHRRLAPARGWTLVELLVAMALSLLVIAGIAQIYLAAKRSYDIQTNIAEIQDVGRYVTDLLTHDIRMAGYWDSMDINLANSTPGNDGNPNGTPSSDSLFLTGRPNLPEDCSSNNSWGRMITRSIFGINDGNGIASYSCIGSDLLRGDVLTVRYADPVAIPATGPFTNTALYIRTAPFQGSVVFGNPEDCPPGTSGCALINYVNDPVFSDHALVAHAYYVATPISTSCGTVPVFARKTLDSTGTPRKESLVNGVEQLQFQYGVDTAVTAANPLGDGSVNQYLNADQVTNWHRVRAIRFWALVRANCQESGYTDTATYQLGDRTYTPNDRYRRTLYSSTVALRN